MKKWCLGLVLLLVCLAQAQIAKGATKFLGNITTSGSVRSDFLQYWNQITAENECKWDQVENSRDNMNWGGCDAVYDFAKKNGIPTKFHTFVWGSQYPTWLGNLSTSEQLAEITEWYDAAAKRYPDLDMIDVVNEAIQGHAPFPYTQALGGSGSSGFDWIITAFKMARERWPNAILIYNDYNSISWQRKEYIQLMTAIKDCGYVDAMGFQAHSLDHLSGAEVKTYIDEIYNAIGLPMYITEYDIEKTNDTEQLNIMKDQFPVFWEHPHIAGVTLWGYILGTTWREGTGIINQNGTPRPALTWLQEYVAAHLDVPAPVVGPGGSSGPRFVTKSAISLDQGVALVAKLEAKASEAVSFAISGGADESLFVLSGSDLSFNNPPAYKTGSSNQYAVSITATAGEESATLNMTVTILPPQTPYQGVAWVIPGKIEFEHYDECGNGCAYSDDSEGNDGGASFRMDEDVDLEDCSDDGEGYNLGWATAGEWVEYTVNVQYPGIYDLVIRAATENDNTILITSNGEELVKSVSISSTGGWQTWQDFTVKDVTLKEGIQVLRFTIGSDYVNLNYIHFEPVSVAIQARNQTLNKTIPQTRLFYNKEKQSIFVRVEKNGKVQLIDVNGQQ